MSSGQRVCCSGYYCDYDVDMIHSGIWPEYFSDKLILVVDYNELLGFSQSCVNQWFSLHPCCFDSQAGNYQIPLAWGDNGSNNPVQLTIFLFKLWVLSGDKQVGNLMSKIAGNVPLKSD